MKNWAFWLSVLLLLAAPLLFGVVVALSMLTAALAAFVAFKLREEGWRELDGQTKIVLALFSGLVLWHILWLMG